MSATMIVSSIRVLHLVRGGQPQGRMTRWRDILYTVYAPIVDVSSGPSFSNVCSGDESASGLVGLHLKVAAAIVGSPV